MISILIEDDSEKSIGTKRKKDAELYEFIAISEFDKDLKKYNISDDILNLIQAELINDMYAGTLIPRSCGFYKLREKKEDRGKRGGIRTIYYPIESKSRIYLCRIYVKNKKTDLTQSEMNQLKAIFKRVAESITEEIDMSFFDDLAEAARQIVRYESGDKSCGRVLKPVFEMSESSDSETKEQTYNLHEMTALGLKPNGKVDVIHTDVFSTHEELKEEYETYGYQILSIYDGYVEDSELLES